jgi:hypothetical protein
MTTPNYSEMYPGEDWLVYDELEIENEPIQLGDCRKGEIIVKNHLCKIVSHSVSPTSRSGRGIVVSIVGEDLFTKQKYTHVGATRSTMYRFTYSTIEDEVIFHCLAHLQNWP